MFGFIIFALIIGLIWLEIIIFGLVGSAIGVLLTIIGVFVTAALGLNLFRRTGRATMARMAQTVQSGQTPIVEVADGIAIVLGAGLLLIPGYATDTLGFVLFVPGLRVAVILVLYAMLKPLAPKFSKGTNFKFYQHKAYQQGFGGFNPDAQQNHPFQDQNQIDDDPSSTIIEGDYERNDKD